jgi:hypothetical protein
LVIVFGGALAKEFYQHLSSPVNAIPAVRRKPARAPAPSAEAPKPAAAAAPAPAAANPLPSRPAGGAVAPTATTTAAGPKAAKPSLLAEPMKGRQAPTPQSESKTAQPAAATDAASGEKRHSVPVEFKLKASSARSVQLVGAFIVRGGRREMVRQDEGVWSLTLYLLPGTSYRYWFLVNGKKTLDPENRQVDRGASVLALP